LHFEFAFRPASFHKPAKPKQYRTSIGQEESMRAVVPLTRTSPLARRGFTLVELLTVIIIIGLLTGLLVAAIGRAMVSARDARVIAEIAQLDSAMKQYKDKYGSYPPANWTTGNSAAVIRHFRRAFPRASAPTVVDLDPAEVLVYALGGVPASSGSTKVTGFSLNPTNPLGSGGQRSTPLFQFDQSRLVDIDNDGFWEYLPDGMTLPYIYFDSSSYASPSAVGSATTGYAKPYLDAATSGGYMNANSFQIISAGQDEHYGAVNAGDGSSNFPLPSPARDGDLDNLTNFSTTRLEEAAQ
jgi:prepilin-type N-terminal cleavage/methylation domain-containing protein